MNEKDILEPTVVTSNLSESVDEYNINDTNILEDVSDSEDSGIFSAIIDVPVTGVMLSNNEDVTVGNWFRLTATISPLGATNKKVTWSSSNPSVASLSLPAGTSIIVTGESAGSSAVTVTTDDGGYTATCNVTVSSAYVPVTSVTVTPSTLSLEVGSSSGLNATVLPDNATIKDVTWTSSNSSVATVDSNGNVTAVSTGTATITCTADQGKTSTCNVTVTPQYVPVSSVDVIPTSSQLSIGDTLIILKNILPDNATNKDVTWSSSNSSVATVDSNGTVRAIAAGSATITCRTQDQGKTATCSINVKSVVHVTSVTLDHTSISMFIDTTQLIVATIHPSDAEEQRVSWSSSKSSVASVDSNGTVTAHTEGDAVITCTTFDGGHTATCSVHVTDPTVHVESVTVSPTSLNLNIGSSSTITATVLPKIAWDRSVTWSSSNSSVASVNSSGQVTANAYGTATITCTTNDRGLTATCSVSVSYKTFTIGSYNDYSYNSTNFNIGFSCEDTGSINATLSRYSGGTFLSYLTVNKSSGTTSGTLTGAMAQFNERNNTFRTETLKLSAPNYETATFTIKQYDIQLTGGPRLVQGNITIVKGLESNIINRNVEYDWQDGQTTTITGDISNYNSTYLSYNTTTGKFTGKAAVSNTPVTITWLFGGTYHTLTFNVTVIDKYLFIIDDPSTYEYNVTSSTLSYSYNGPMAPTGVTVEVSPGSFITSASVNSTNHTISLQMNQNSTKSRYGYRSTSITLKAEAAGYANKTIFINQYDIHEISRFGKQADIDPLYIGTTAGPLDAKIYTNYEDAPSTDVLLGTGTLRKDSTNYITLYSDGTIEGVSAGVSHVYVDYDGEQAVHTITATVYDKMPIDASNVTAVYYQGQEWYLPYSLTGTPTINVSSNQSWLSVLGDSLNKRIKLTFTQNTSNSPRSATVTISATSSYATKSITVMQWGQKPTAQIETTTVPTINGYYANTESVTTSNRFKMSDANSWTVGVYSDTTYTTPSSYITGTGSGSGSNYSSVTFTASPSYHGQERTETGYVLLKSTTNYNSTYTGLLKDTSGSTVTEQSVSSLRGYATNTWSIIRNDWDYKALNVNVSWDTTGKRLTEYNTQYLEGVITNQGAAVSIQYGWDSRSVAAKINGVTSTPTVNINTNTSDGTLVDGSTSLGAGFTTPTTGGFKFRLPENTSGNGRIYIPYVKVSTTTGQAQTTTKYYGNQSSAIVYNSSAQGCVVHPSYLNLATLRPLIDENGKVYTCESGTSNGKFIYEKHDCLLINNSMVQDDKYRCLDTRVEVKQ